ncbi:MAG: hypothetical protein AUI01_08070 [Ktedonobacter sp. 13_2_20CM_2_56_8]|nr:MAG: hypothetical protein AUH05_16070 [Ktedonobacter sp. 13_2_20CM_53_11]OLB55428.1 MAG: hypothetical protein AUI01_08070 [Ktedonobacter sp. 13_2_20CM_2_56_8]OLD79163.1 MAG: hypothetical protein AUG54_06930 [Ktedonobacter sp. 13_1_20CM_4_53_7]
MPGYQTGSKDQEDNIVPPPETFQTRRSQWPDNLLAQNSGRLLDRADSVIYFIVGVCFFLAAIMALTYTFWALGVSIIELRALPMNQQPTQGAQAIIELVSGLLLVLIIMEMLGTVIHYLQVHATSLRPFLFIGIISATRSILSIGARLSVEGFSLRETDFTHAMIELGVSAAVILALGITLKLLSGMFEDGESK